jgi:hypothetical protein
MSSGISQSPVLPGLPELLLLQTAAHRMADIQIIVAVFEILAIQLIPAARSD